MKNKQGITIAALIIAIVGLSIGFAAFSNTLTISSSATVTPSDENFIVQFSKVSDADQTGSEYPIVPNIETYGDNAIINSSNKKLLEGVHAKFTAPGQSVTYTLYVRNTGAYVAYLKELAFANATNATGSETYKHCYAATTDSNGDDIPAAQQATPSLVTQACNGIDISVTIGTASNITPSSASKSLGNQALQANGGYVQATITISYDSNAAYVDGPMEVEFGNISFTAASNQGSSQGGSVPTPATPTYSVGDTYTGDFISTEAGVITGYEGNGGSIAIPDSLPVVQASSSTFNSTKCNSLMGDSVWCTEAQKKYNGLDYDENFDDSYESYDQAISYLLDNVYIVSNAIPQTITKIGMGAFMSKGIESVIFTNNITEIGTGAFMENSLTTLDIPNSVTIIGEAAFHSENSSLSIVTIHNVEGMVAIGKDAINNNAVISYVGTGQ